VKRTTASLASSALRVSLVLSVQLGVATATLLDAAPRGRHQERQATSPRETPTVCHAGVRRP
jgi:hypothetical protein